MAFLHVFLALLLTRSAFSQSNDQDNNTNVLTGMFCGHDAVIILPNFIKNRNSTFNQLRMQLLSKRALYARAQVLGVGDSVYAAAQCRNYLSVDQCVACVDAGFTKMVNCEFGAFVSFDNCFVRYFFF